MSLSLVDLLDFDAEPCCGNSSSLPLPESLETPVYPQEDKFEWISATPVYFRPPSPVFADRRPVVDEPLVEKDPTPLAPDCPDLEKFLPEKSLPVSKKTLPAPRKSMQLAGEFLKPEDKPLKLVITRSEKPSRPAPRKSMKLAKESFEPEEPPRVVKPLKIVLKPLKLEEKTLPVAEKSLKKSLAEKPSKPAKKSLKPITEKPAKKSLDVAEKPLRPAKKSLDVAEKPVAEKHAKKSLDVAEKPEKKSLDMVEKPAKKSLKPVTEKPAKKSLKPEKKSLDTGEKPLKKSLKPVTEKPAKKSLDTGEKPLKKSLKPVTENPAKKSLDMGEKPLKKSLDHAEKPARKRRLNIAQRLFGDCKRVEEKTAEKKRVAETLPNEPASKKSKTCVSVREKAFPDVRAECRQKKIEEARKDIWSGFGGFKIPRRSRPDPASFGPEDDLVLHPDPEDYAYVFELPEFEYPRFLEAYAKRFLIC